jgi:DNA (cytosine-5)-methyltransferase 1
MNTIKKVRKLKIIEAAPLIPQYKFIDLFCGIGGFHQALLRLRNQTADFKCVFACDIDAKCREVYEKNYGLKPHGDITKINMADIPNFDILCAGFPCQSFSNSGKKKAFEDPRGNLFENILQIATSKRPSFLFLENVKHIKKINNGKVFAHILQRINESGYTVTEEKQVFELSPHQLGIPQQRERLIFVCIRTDIYNPAKEIIICPPNKKSDMSRILENNVDSKYKISNEIEQILKVWDEMIKTVEVGETLSPTILCNEFYKTYSPDEFALLPDWKKDYITKNKPLYTKYKKQWDEWYALHSTLLQKKEVFGKLEWQVGKKKNTEESIFNYFIQIRQSGIRVKKTKYFPTLVAIVQTPIYAKEMRYITPRECARLQSFPDSFIMHENDHTAYKHFGNAVNVDVVHFVMNEVLKVYEWIV